MSNFTHLFTRAARVYDEPDDMEHTHSAERVTMRELFPNCAKPARIVSISLPSGLSSIGSVTETILTPCFRSVALTALDVHVG